MKRVLRAIARIVGWPVRTPFKPWFHHLGRRLDEVEGSTSHRITEARWSIEEVVIRETNVVQGEVHRKIDEVEARLNRRLDALDRAIVACGETTIEVARATTRAVERMRAEVVREVDRHHVAEAIWPLVGQPLAELSEPAAHLVNWANSAIGMAGEGGVFVNNGLNLQFHAGGAELVEVSERIVELPFASAVGATLPLGSHVLDVGARESSLSLELANLGHRTVALDPRGYPFDHPNLTVVVESAEDWIGPAEPFDAVFCISTIEHVGLGAYGLDGDVPDLDMVIMERLRGWLRADGQCVLTVPFGRWSVDSFQRVYDDEHLERLVDGWKITQQQRYRRLDARAWAPFAVDEPWPDERTGVALLLLQPG